LLESGIAILQPASGCALFAEPDAGTFEKGMGMNFDTARFNMIEQQIRPWDVLDQSVLDLLTVVKREEFVPHQYRNLAFVDREIPLPHGQNMLTPKVEARMLQELAVMPDETVLEIGTGSGYMAALFARKAKHVTSVEIIEELKAFATENLLRADIRNVTLVLGDGARGYPSVGEVDVLMVSGSLPVVPQALLDQLAVGGRMGVFVGDAPAMTAQIITRTGSDSWEPLTLFETVTTPLINALQPSRFTF
jgi:protein-L-isoaspartate(D-aspartate) O-methyltransferase